MHGRSVSELSVAEGEVKMPANRSEFRRTALSRASATALAVSAAMATPAAAALYVESGGSLDGGTPKSLNDIAGFQVTAVTGDIFTDFSSQDAFYFTGLDTGVQTFSYDISAIQGFVTMSFTENSMSTDFMTFVDGVGMFTTSAAFNGTLAIHIEAEGQPASGTYSIALETATVPVPAAAALMVPGLAALGAAARRRRAKRR